MTTTPDYLSLYLNEVHGDFYGADYYRAAAAQNESAIIYDDAEDKRTVSALLVTSFGPRRSLEVGCAMGLMVKALRGHGVEAEGIDFSRWCIESAHPQVRDWVRWGDVLELGEPERRFDLVLALDVLEHLPPEKVPVALANIAGCLTDGGIVFTVIPAYGPNAFGPETFPLTSPSWKRDAELGIPFVDIPLDDKGRPHLGHLTHATIDWWQAAFEREGLQRLGPVERLLHDRYDATLQHARRSFFVFVNSRPIGRWRTIRRLTRRIASVPGLPWGFWQWERWGGDGMWMRWTREAAWEPIEVRGRRILRLRAICNHPDIGSAPVTVTFRIDERPAHCVVFQDHDWHIVELPAPRRPFVGLQIHCSRTWAADEGSEPGSGRVIGTGIAHEA